MSEKESNEDRKFLPDEFMNYEIFHDLHNLESYYFKKSNEEIILHFREQDNGKNINFEIIPIKKRDKESQYCQLFKDVFLETTAIRIRFEKIIDGRQIGESPLSKMAEALNLYLNQNNDEINN